MSETPDWKQKYRNSLVEAEAEEKRWRAVEQVLRRLIGRLCAAAMGVDPQLDNALTTLATANRRNADAAELERLVDRLTTAVMAADENSPLITGTAPNPGPAVPSVEPHRLQSTCAAIRALLERLPAGEATALRIKELVDRLALADTDAVMADVVATAADLIEGHCDSLARERLQTAALLSQVTQRLEDVASFLTESSSANRRQLDDAQSLNEGVMSEVRELTNAVSRATHLAALQATIGARLDPLTGVANRKSFDERFARELSRRTPDGVSAVLLLWDIDDFKSINDSYGHRAGDRVLQAVAECISKSLRSTDFVARIGGEEFAVLLSGLPPSEAGNVANQVRVAVASLRFHFRGTPVRVTVSCGITELACGLSAGDTFDRADAALYRAKSGGKNLCVAA